VTASRNNAVGAVYLFLRDGQKVLLMRRTNTKYQDGNYAVPAGHIDSGELPTEAMIREAKEEIGIVLLPGYLKMVHVSFRPKHDETGDRIDFFFEADRWQGEVINAEPQKCDDLRWVSLDDLPSNMTPHVKVALLAVDRGEIFSQLSISYMRSTGLYELS
jgi:ADP-ribose pyrophosphatase YjhB (NUDIX family)